MAGARAALPGVLGGFLLCSVGALAAVIVGLPVLRFFVGTRFQASFSLVPWVGGALVIGSFFSAFVNVISLRKATRIIPVITGAAVAANVALNFVLVPRFGVRGAIGATALALFIRTLVLAVVASQTLRRLAREEPVAAKTASAA